MAIDQLNYLQMKVFIAVYRHRNASVASNELGMTNSAVSRALATLRRTFDDELFVRTGSGFVPTERAESIAPILEQAVGNLRCVEKQFARFDPEESESAFEIRVYDEFSYAVQSVIGNIISKKAPKMRFNVRLLTYDCIGELVRGEVDFAVVYEGFGDKRLKADCFARTGDIYLLCRNGHPLTRSKLLTAKEISQYPLLEIDNYRDLSCPLLVNVCQEKSCSMKVATYTESVAAAFQIIARSDCVAVVCNQFTRQLADTMPGLDYVVLPAGILSRIKQMRSEVRPIGNYLVYGSANLSPAFEWVRRELFEGLKSAWEKASLSNKKYPQAAPQSSLNVEMNG